jgi:hypothetical protein
MHPYHSRSLAPERVDEHLTRGAVGEGMDAIDVDKVGEFIVLVGETLDTPMEGLVMLQIIVVEIP